MATKTKAKNAGSSSKTIKQVLTKSALTAHIVGSTGVASKDVRSVMTALEGAICGSIAKRGAGMFVLPGLLKITSVNVPAKPQRKGINPFTGQEQVFAAKPATVKVKVRPMKKLKDAARS